MSNIMASALTRELEAAAKELAAEIRRHGYATHLDGTVFDFPFARQVDLEKAEADRRSVPTLIKKISDERKEAIARHDENLRRIHAVAARFDEVKAMLDEAKAGATTEGPR